MPKNLLVSGVGVGRGVQMGKHIHKSLCWGEQSACEQLAHMEPRDGWKMGLESPEAGTSRPCEGLRSLS